MAAAKEENEYMLSKLMECPEMDSTYILKEDPVCSMSNIHDHHS